MCWVIPPASPAATSVSRIASSSEVLPWSTWPMTATTGGRSTRSSSASSYSGSSLDLVGRVDDLDLLLEAVGEHLDRLVGQRLGERGHLAELHQLLDHLGRRTGRATRRPRLTVAPDWIGVSWTSSTAARPARQVGLDPRRAAPAPAAARRLLRRRRAGGRGARPGSRSRRGGGCRRRRRLPPSPARPARVGRAPRVAPRCCGAAPSPPSAASAGGLRAALRLGAAFVLGSSAAGRRGRPARWRACARRRARCPSRRRIEAAAFTSKPAF